MIYCARVSVLFVDKFVENLRVWFFIV